MFQGYVKYFGTQSQESLESFLRDHDDTVATNVELIPNLVEKKDGPSSHSNVSIAVCYFISPYSRFFMDLQEYENPLWIAYDCNKVHFLSELIKTKKFDVSEPNASGSGDTLLHLVAEPDIIKLLIEAGADANLSNKVKTILLVFDWV